MTDEELDYMDFDANRERESRLGQYEPHMIAHVLALTAEVRRFKCEIVGLQKANALLNAGMGDVCESRDDMKLELRKLKGEQS
jgi:hypothetical protein